MSNILAVTYDAAIAVTKSDTLADPAGPFAATLIGTGGTLKFTDIQGNTVVIDTLAPGEIIYVTCSRVWNTGTSATVYGLRALPYAGKNVGVGGT